MRWARRPRPCCAGSRRLGRPRRRRRARRRRKPRRPASARHRNRAPRNGRRAKRSRSVRCERGRARPRSRRRAGRAAKVRRRRRGPSRSSMADPGGDIAPPSALLLALEPRGLFSFARLIAAAPFLATAPRGAPQAAIVLPGLGATDRSTAAIRAYLKFLGYEAHGWSRGRNVRPAGADLPAVAAQIRSLQEATGTPVSLVGWSRLTGEAFPAQSPQQLQALAAPLPVPCTSIYSCTDGVVAWRACLQAEGPRS